MGIQLCFVVEFYHRPFAPFRLVWVWLKGVFRVYTDSLKTPIVYKSCLFSKAHVLENGAQYLESGFSLSLGSSFKTMIRSKKEIRER